MKKIILILALLFLAIYLSAQIEQHTITVRNIEIPVRVFAGDEFVKDLTITDFELMEEGNPQEILALYQVQNGKIIRMDAERDFMPVTERHFYFIFQILDYNPKLNEAMQYFFENLFRSGDTVTVITPVKNYILSPEAAKNKPTEKLVSDMVNVIRRDTKLGSLDYNNMLKDLKMMVRSISGSVTGLSGTSTEMESDVAAGLSSLQFVLPRYRETLQKMEELRVVDEKRFLLFAQGLKRMLGQKYVYFFYQREFRPELQARVLNSLMSMNQDDSNVLSQLQELFQFYHRDINLNTERLTKAFADSSLNFNFIFMNKEPEHISGVDMREQSEDVFKVFSDVSEATGGVVDNSQNPAAAFKNASKRNEYYYLLYYSPKNYMPDGQFKKITVKLKNDGYKIDHRLGYIAD
ncbi:MAG: VWA domain-containing protein [Candidatus Aminicenantes bacterium]|nr:VWA domain-containing protein [Candidatus Aminicenantes bacterium]